MTRPSDALLRLLHLCDSLFPIGSFAYSDGLESAAAAGLVTGKTGLGEWLEMCRDEGFGRTDGPAIAIVWSALERADWDAVVTIDEEVTALRASSTTRMANRSMGHGKAGRLPGTSFFRLTGSWLRKRAMLPKSGTWMCRRSVRLSSGDDG